MSLWSQYGALAVVEDVGTHLEDVLLPHELLPLPTRQEAELGADEADLARPAPDHSGSAGE